jgi:hypothetical protein
MEKIKSPGFVLIIKPFNFIKLPGTKIPALRIKTVWYEPPPPVASRAAEKQFNL